MLALTSIPREIWPLPLDWILGADILFMMCSPGAAMIQEAVISTQYGDILPSDIMLSTAEVAFTAPRREFMLAQQLNLLSGAYDFVVIDTPPALNILTINAYVASTSLIIPMEAEVLSLVGISQIQDTIEAVRQSILIRT